MAGGTRALNSSFLVSQATSWEDKLNNLNERFDIWIDVQRRWVYLESIFLGSQEIKYQLPNEYRRFQTINTDFTTLQREVAKNPGAIDVLSIESCLERLTKLQTMLTNIQRALGDYLEKQRAQFARFYFVGDEDLLELIGSSKDPKKVQKHFSKMFAGVVSLVLDEEMVGEELKVKVVGCRSHAQMEHIVFKNPVDVSVDPRINIWLGKLEKEIRYTLARFSEDGLKELRTLAPPEADFDKGFSPKKGAFLDWIAKMPSQVGLIVVQVQWTEATEVAINSASSTGSVEPLEKLVAGVESSLGLLAAQARPATLSRLGLCGAHS